MISISTKEPNTVSPQKYPSLSAPFPWGLLLGTFLIAASGHILSVQLNEAAWRAQWLEPCWFTALAAIILCWGATQLHAHRFSDHLLRYLLPSALALDWLALQSHRTLEKFPYWALLVGSLLIFVLSVWITHALHKKLQTATAIINEPAEKLLGSWKIQKYQ